MPSAGVYFHYLHHAHFEINFGDTVMPLDYLFGSFCNGPPSKKPKHK
jgi:sterol desaturase/sphingolipid hydroxylase (fatty acid hydroxylase superfamily)